MFPIFDDLVQPTPEARTPEARRVNEIFAYGFMHSLPAWEVNQDLNGWVRTLASLGAWDDGGVRGPEFQRRLDEWCAMQGDRRYTR